MTAPITPTAGPLRKPANIPHWLWDAVQDLYSSLEEFDEKAARAAQQSRNPDAHERVWCNATAYLLFRGVRNYEKIRDRKAKT